jgi:hypothetical protein
MNHTMHVQGHRCSGRGVNSNEVLSLRLPQMDARQSGCRPDVLRVFIMLGLH